jgi:hypothetical protein
MPDMLVGLVTGSGDGTNQLRVTVFSLDDDDVAISLSRSHRYSDHCFLFLAILLGSVAVDRGIVYRSRCL